jgi:hypothetical protein
MKSALLATLNLPHFGYDKVAKFWARRYKRKPVGPPSQVFLLLKIITAAFAIRIVGTKEHSSYLGMPWLLILAAASPPATEEIGFYGSRDRIPTGYNVGAFLLRKKRIFKLQ